MRFLVGLIFIVVIGASTPVNLSEYKHIRIDRHNEFVLRSEAFFQELRLPPGLYTASYRTDGRIHYVVLRTTRIEVRLECQMEPLQRKARHTAVFYTTDKQKRMNLIGYTRKGQQWFCRFTL